MFSLTTIAGEWSSLGFQAFGFTAQAKMKVPQAQAKGGKTPSPKPESCQAPVSWTGNPRKTMFMKDIGLKENPLYVLGCQGVCQTNSCTRATFMPIVRGKTGLQPMRNTGSETYARYRRLMSGTYRTAREVERILSADYYHATSFGVAS